MHFVNLKLNGHTSGLSKDKQKHQKEAKITHNQSGKSNVRVKVECFAWTSFILVAQVFLIETNYKCS
jgi:hypothetical protein